ncbi:hypothetical protein M7775_02030 [Sporomusa sphaeroides DSM 2875]|uniref:DUF6848 family protein n=1 Tax=Sporomusa sphaeroides TaxID=47679 RepID=UPI0020305095|nr:hypothetical protein [Sporomusa sphaeroides]MCM0757346.1 hypothetical protein [Sporomusa sphaeroides DSM 2875]
MDKVTTVGPTEKQMEEWKTRYGEVYKLVADVEDDSNTENEATALVLYMRKPSRQHLSRLAKSLQQDTLKAFQNFITDTLLYPAGDVLEKCFHEKPGLVIPVASKLQEIVGTNQNFTVTKL